MAPELVCKKFRVSHQHFSFEYEDGSSRGLLPFAIPTIHLPGLKMGEELIPIAVFDNSTTESVRVCATRENNAIDMVLLQGANSYQCRVSPSDAAEFARLLEVDVAEYTKKLMSCLTKKSSDVQVEISGNKVTVVKDRCKYFSGQIVKTDYAGTVERLLDRSAAANMSLFERIDELKREMEEVANERDVYKSKLEEYVKSSALREKQLYGAFVQLLNEKKKRIQYLNDVLEGGNYNPSKKKCKLDEAVGRKRETISESEDESYNTDDDVEDPTTIDSPQPGPSKDVDLLDDDSDEAPKPTVLPRRTVRTIKKDTCSVVAERPVEKPESPEEQSVPLEATQTVSFSTQDMIDSI